MKKEYNIAFSREHSSTSYITTSIFHSNQAFLYKFYIVIVEWQVLGGEKGKKKKEKVDYSLTSVPQPLFNWILRNVPLSLFFIIYIFSGTCIPNKLAPCFKTFPTQYVKYTLAF